MHSFDKNNNQCILYNLKNRANISIVVDPNKFLQGKKEHAQK